jgi:hypothetical protein
MIQGLIEKIKNKLQTSSFFAISVLVHVFILVLVSGVVLVDAVNPLKMFEIYEGGQEDIPPPPDADDSAMAGGGGDGQEGATDLNEQSPYDAPTTGEAVLSDLITTDSPNARSPFSSSGLPIPTGGSMTGIAGSKGYGTGRGAGRGLGKGSGFGSGIGNWVGPGGLGISGRGKTLKTEKEFYVYFVIYSGDWYAALDWRDHPANRSREESYEGLPDTDSATYQNYVNSKDEWNPKFGPFINHAWGRRSPNKNPPHLYNLGGRTVEFTAGAMSNLLTFTREASKDAIKGGKRPKAVVLDRSLLPYKINEKTGDLEWNAEARDKFRSTLKNALPKGNVYTVTGYRWNPRPNAKPEDPWFYDFEVEYLLDVKPMPPFIYLTGNADFEFSEAEQETLYQYILRGGAIWADSGFAGNRSKFDVAFRREIKKIVTDEDKQFKELPAGSTLFVRGEDAYVDMPELPYGMQFYTAPIQVMETFPGVYSIVLTKNGYGNFLRYEMVRVNNEYSINPSDRESGLWVRRMWQFRDEFFRGLSSEGVRNSYFLGANVLVYMLYRWQPVLQQLENWNKAP